MCRLLGFVAHTLTTLEGLLGEDLASFTELSLKHGDGWGVAVREHDGVSVQKSLGAARRSPEFGELTRDLITDTALVHLRWATLGLPITWDNALAATVDQVGHVAHSSLNALLLTSDSLHAVCSYTAEAEAEAEEDDYYRMGYAVRDGAVIVASSGWGSGWTEMASGTILSVRRDTGALSLRDLCGRARPAPVRV